MKILHLPISKKRRKIFAQKITFIARNVKALRKIDTNATKIRDKNNDATSQMAAAITDIYFAIEIIAIFPPIFNLMVLKWIFKNFHTEIRSRIIEFSIFSL